MTGPMVHCPGCEADVPSADVWGVELPGVYDGVLYWQHPACGRAWARGFTSPILAEASVKYAARANQRGGR